MDIKIKKTKQATKIKRKPANLRKTAAPFTFFKRSKNYDDELKPKEVPAANQINFEEALKEIEKTKLESDVVVINDNEQINESEQKVIKQKGKKGKILGLIFILINIGIVVSIFIEQYHTDNLIPLSDVLGGINYWFLLISVLAFVVLTFLEIVKFAILIRPKMKKFYISLSYKVGVLGRYYDNITPLSAGGEPFQIYYLKSRGMKASDSISVPLGKYAFFQLTYQILITVVIFSTLFSSSIMNNNVGTTLVSAASWIGFSLNFCIMFLIIFLSINRRLGTKLVTFFLKFLKKIKIIRNYDKTYNNVIRIVDDFQGTMRYYAKDPKIFTMSFFVSIISLILQYTIPFFVYCTFAGYQPALWWDILVMSVMIDLAACFIPVPGGSGVAELSFTALFASLFVGGQLFWALLLWRFLSYYSHIVQGLFVILYEYFVGEKKFQWYKKKWQLENESERFKVEQLSEFKSKKRKLKKV